AVLALPSLWLGQFVPDNLRRREELPGYWREAAAALDAGDHATRVLVVPGSDFASYRWGNTVDPVLPGLIDRPSVQRELAPYGSAASTDLLTAFDITLQERTADPQALAPIARLVRAGDVLVQSDLQYERFNTPRPRNLWDLVRRAGGLGPARAFGPGRPNETVPEVQLRDELLLVTDPDVPDPPELAVLPVDDPVPIVAAQPADHPLLVAGDGAGLVDAAAAGLIDGTELVRYSATLSAPDVADALDRGAALLVTDANRKRGERWSTLRHDRGYTETATAGVLGTDLNDNRLPLFPGAGTASQSVTVRTGPVDAEATSYGNPITFSPEERPSLAVDGDPRTAWRTAAFADARHERLQLTLAEPTTTDRVTLVQPTEGAVTRWISRVRLRFDGGDPLDVDLGTRSRDLPGEVVTFGERTFRRLSLEVLADSAGDVPRYAGQSSVGFAEVEVGAAPNRPSAAEVEAVRVPTDLLAMAGAGSRDHPLAVSLTRQRQDPTEPTREDEEQAIVRLVDLPTRRSFTLAGTARLSARADPPVRDAVLDRAHDDRRPWARASTTLTGDHATAAAAFDGDPATAWTSVRTEPFHQWVEAVLPRPVTFDRLPLTVVADGLHSVPTEVELWVDGR
ncbi:MAG TPA: alpha-(1-_3)-arabinofuranosyltransferase family protein, partial [Acidimicrobiales bacterium]